jgi:L-malate glycosyltransferase
MERAVVEQRVTEIDKERILEGRAPERDVRRDQGTRPVRVLFVAPSMDIVGGQSEQASRIMARLAEEPEVRVGFQPINPRLPAPLRFLQAIKYVRTLLTSLVYLMQLLWRVPSYDIIHIYSASYLSFLIAPTPALLVSRLYGKRTILNYHSGEAEDHLGRWRRTALPLIRRFDAIIVQSQYLVEVFARFGFHARAISNIIETKHLNFRLRGPGGAHFLSNRNFEAHYNVACVLRAFALVQREREDARLTVAGDGPERVPLETLARSLGLRQVEFTGSVSWQRMSELYDEADVYLNGSEIDNMPLSILEAYAAGLPVVTTDAGGIPYILRDEETGLMVARDDAEAMARAALRLLRDTELARRLAEQGRAECRKYSWEAVREDWLGLYRELASAKMLSNGRETGTPNPLISD